MNDLQQGKKIRHAVDRSLSGLQGDPGLAQRLLAKTKEETKMRKWPLVSLVATAILVLAAVTALAVMASSWIDASKFLRKQSEQGTFAAWSDKEKVELVASLAESGLLEKSKELELLLYGSLDENEAAALAEKLMTEWLHAPVDRVAFQPIIKKAWGSFDGWTLEQKAWYTQTLIDAGMQGPDMEIFLLPDNKAIAQRDAESIARTYAEIWTDAIPGAYDACDVVSEFVIFPHTIKRDGKWETTTEGVSPVWHVQIKTPYRQGSTIYIEIDPYTGNAMLQPFVIEAIYDRCSISLTSHKIREALGQKETQTDICSFFDWSLEEKARWSEIVRPQLIAKKEERPGLHNDIIATAFSQYCYGLPQEHSLPQEEALEAARRAIQENGEVTTEDLRKYDTIYIYYDVTAPDTPLWRFHFSMNGAQAIEEHDNLYEMTNYRVEVNGKTGEVVKVESYRLKDFPGFSAVLQWV